MTARRLIRSILLLIILLTSMLGTPTWTAAQQIPSPEEFFGFQMGADRKLAHWDDLLRYYDLIGEHSDRVMVQDMGSSTLGNRFIVLFISSPENLRNLENLKRLNAILQDPRGHSEAEIEEAVQNGKVVFVQSYGLHASEVAASQTIAEVTWEMATREDEVMRGILENTVAIMIPCLNPDGEIMITEWYNQWVGTEYEGASLPVLYHPYVGHDNNRDAFMTNMVESEYGARILFRDWIPQGFIDHHQMGSTTARMAIPPYAEPIRPEADPLVWREMDWWGGFMGYKMDQAGLSGVIGGAIYSGWGHFGFHWITPFHNIAGMLTEGAST
ncbi:M14 family zinc carboxypeptidase, partial [Gemmatimonadota bacterium]